MQQTPTKKSRRNKKMLLAKTLGNLVGFFLGGKIAGDIFGRHLRLEFHQKTHKSENARIGAMHCSACFMNLAELSYFTNLDFPAKKLPKLGGRRVFGRYDHESL